MATDQERLEAAKRFVEIWDELTEGPFDDTASSLTCEEADAVADLFRAFDRNESADHFIEVHSRSDEEDDSHYNGTKV
jgi:hypothetical protein